MTQWWNGERRLDGAGPHSMQPVRAIGLFLLGIAMWRAATAFGDTVWVRKEGRGPVARKGTIVDRRRDYLLLERIAGRPEKIMETQIDRVEYQRSALQERADALFDAMQYADALPALEQAIEVESRDWVRRELLARRCRALRNVGRMTEAAETFRQLMALDATRYHLNAAPLRWKMRLPDAAMQNWGTQHLSSDEPAVRLVAASWLLSGPHRAEAVAALKQLELDHDSQLARWAAFQHQRALLVQWDEATATRYAARIRKLDESLRAGPCFLVGTAFGRLKRNESSIEWLLRVAMLYPHDVEIAAESLYRAGDAAMAVGRPGDARRMWQLLSDRYPQHPAARRAASRQKASQE